MQAKSFLGQGHLYPAGAALPLSSDVLPLSSRISIPSNESLLAMLQPLSSRMSGGPTGPPDGSLFAMLQDPAKDNQLQELPLNFASDKNHSDVVYKPWNDSTMSSDSFLPVPKDGGTLFGQEGSRFAPHGDGEQRHTLNGEMRAGRLPYGYQVPVGLLPACKSNPRRRRRRFTNGEKSIISYKRKVGVCRDCRQAKRKVSLVIMSVFFC